MRAVAGSLRQRITLQTYMENQDAFGQPVKTWSDLLTDEPAAVVPMRGAEIFAAAQVQGKTPYTVIIRWHTAIVPDNKMRVVHEGKILDVESVMEPQEARREIHLYCTHRQQDGWRT